MLLVPGAVVVAQRRGYYGVAGGILCRRFRPSPPSCIATTAINSVERRRRKISENNNSVGVGGHSCCIGGTASSSLPLQRSNCFSSFTISSAGGSNSGALLLLLQGLGAVSARRQRRYCSFSADTTPDNNNSRELLDEAANSSPSFFGELKGLDRRFKLALRQSGLREPTEVQVRTWQAAAFAFEDRQDESDSDSDYHWRDVVGRARTGTGKTLAFLLPIVERVHRSLLLRQTTAARQQQQQQEEEGGDRVHALIVSPTRELAQQIYSEALMLTRVYDDDDEDDHLSPPAAIHCQVLYGGASKKRDVATFQERTPHILIATPGRLLDHLGSTYLEGDRPFSGFLDSVNTLVLDEVDRLLDMGFRDEVNDILSFLPPQRSRQTLLFSATIPSDVRRWVDSCVEPDRCTYVDCIDDEDPTTHTNSSIRQSYVVLPLSRLVSGVVQLLLELMKHPDHKILVFFPTTSQVSYFAGLLNTGLGRQVLELHSKLSQHERNSASDRFRYAKRGVMFTSDVSARGVDYPDVTHVLQVGVASDRESYIHRLGRTGRAGKKGKGVLVLMDAEKEFLKRDLRGLHLGPNQRLQRMFDRPLSAQLESELMRISYEMRNGDNEQLRIDAEAVYRGLIGYYYSKLRALGQYSTDTLLDIANAFASQAGLRELPIVSEKMAKQYGLLRHPRINVNSRWSVGRNFDVGRRQNKPPS